MGWIKNKSDKTILLAGMLNVVKFEFKTGSKKVSTGTVIT